MAMGITLQVMLMASMVGCFASVAYATQLNATVGGDTQLNATVAAGATQLNATVGGAQGTTAYYFPPYTPTECFGNQNNGVMVAKASDALWKNGAACGQTYSIRCIGTLDQTIPKPCISGSVAVKIVDYCAPPKCQGTFELSQEAYSQIADPNAPKVLIGYTQI